MAKKTGMVKGKDTRMKSFWQDNCHFASLFNDFLFGGRKVLKADQLQEMDTDVSGIINLNGYEKEVKRIRDIVKKAAYGIEFVVAAIENQDRIHYAMPLRMELYDVLGYLKESKTIETKNKCQMKGEKDAKGKLNQDRGKKWNSPDEFLGKICKGDKLHPIISIVIYYGEKPWDGPLSLKDMLIDTSEEILSVISDYRMNLIQIHDSGQYTFSNPDVQNLFELTGKIYAGEFEEVIKEFKDRKVTPETARAVGCITGFWEWEETKEDKEELDMACSSLEKWRKTLIEQGKEQGKEQERRDGIVRNITVAMKFGADCEAAIEMVAMEYQLPEKEVLGIWNSRKDK